MSASTCPSCGADSGTVGVTGGHLCPTCMHREGVAALHISDDRSLLKQCLEALIWCSGCRDFADDGRAAVGWKTICHPVIKKLRDAFASPDSMRKEGTPERMTKELAQLPRKIIQLVPAGDRLFCMCDDGTAWEWTIRDAPYYRWAFLPKPGLPLEVPPGWEKYYPESTT